MLLLRLARRRRRLRRPLSRFCGGACDGAGGEVGNEADRLVSDGRLGAVGQGPMAAEVFEGLRVAGKSVVKLLIFIGPAHF